MVNKWLPVLLIGPFTLSYKRRENTWVKSSEPWLSTQFLPPSHVHGELQAKSSPEVCRPGFV